MKKAIGWVILVCFFAGLISLDGLKHGWIYAAGWWTLTALVSVVLALAIKWVIE